MNKNSKTSFKGFAVIGVVIALVILGSMVAGLALLTATNQNSRWQQLNMDQVHLSSHAALEYSMRQIQTAGNPCTIPLRHFHGYAFALTRSGGKVWDVAIDNAASTSFSAHDPESYTQAGALTIDTSSPVNHAHKILQGLTITNHSCDSPATVTSMSVSWTAYPTSKMTRVQINAVTVYTSGGIGSSATPFSLSPTATISANSTVNLDGIQWDNMPQNQPITIVFNMADGTSTSVTVTVP